MVKKPTRKEKERIQEGLDRRGYAFKETDKRGRVRYFSPKTGKQISLKELREINDRHRSQKTTSDSWATLKDVDPKLAKKIGWNQFQHFTQGSQGSKNVMVSKFLLNFTRTNGKRPPAETIEKWANRKEGTKKKTGWGDSI